MGPVFKARDLRRDRLVALKRLPSELRGNAKLGQLFLSEARAATALQHPHVAKILEVGEALGVYFLALELLDGFTLDTLVRKRGRLSGRDVVRVGVQIAAGLQCAHAEGILHLELGSASLFFTRDKVVKILGFGLATVRETLRGSAPSPGGSSVELAPELATHGAADERTDLYGLGIALFQLATAASPTPGVGGELHVEGVPGALGELIQQLLARDPSQRPLSAAEVGERLLLLAQER